MTNYKSENCNSRKFDGNFKARKIIGPCGIWQHWKSDTSWCGFHHQPQTYKSTRDLLRQQLHRSRVRGFCKFPLSHCSSSFPPQLILIDCLHLKFRTMEKVVQEKYKYMPGWGNHFSSEAKGEPIVPSPQICYHRLLAQRLIWIVFFFRGRTAQESEQPSAVPLWTVR